MTPRETETDSEMWFKRYLGAYSVPQFLCLHVEEGI